MTTKNISLSRLTYALVKLLNLAVTFPQAPFVLLDDRSAREVFGVRFEEIRVIFYFEMVELQKELVTKLGLQWRRLGSWLS